MFVYHPMTFLSAALSLRWWVVKLSTKGSLTYWSWVIFNWIPITLPIKDRPHRPLDVPYDSRNLAHCARSLLSLKRCTHRNDYTHIPSAVSIVIAFGLVCFNIPPCQDLYNLVFETLTQTILQPYAILRANGRTVFRLRLHLLNIPSVICNVSEVHC